MEPKKPLIQAGMAIYESSPGSWRNFGKCDVMIFNGMLFHSAQKNWKLLYWVNCISQLISKGFLGSAISSKKTKGQIQLYYYDTSGRLLFVCFLEEINEPKNSFEINWHLTTCNNKSFNFTSPSLNQIEMVNIGEKSLPRTNKNSQILHFL